jgi:hypothetical protein
VISNATDLVGSGVQPRQELPKANADCLLSLAAAPTFAIMALLAGGDGGSMSDVLCSAAHGASPLSGMVLMYLLMSAFHSTPWLRLITNWRRGASKPEDGTEPLHNPGRAADRHRSGRPGVGGGDQ